MAVRDTTAFRLSEIDTEHFLLGSTFKISKQNHTQRRGNKLIKINKMIKVIYQKASKYYIKQTEWQTLTTGNIQR